MTSAPNNAQRKMTNAIPDFKAAHQFLQGKVDQKILPGVSAAVMKNGVVIDQFCSGHADIERGELLRPDHLFRGFSNGKLITSTLVLLLHDEGHFALDDAIKKWIPGFGKVRVLRKNATHVDDTEALGTDITIRHLLSHQAGLSHGVFDPGTVIFKAYLESGVRRPQTTLAQEMDIMTSLPLVFQPGSGWEYGMGADVLARLVEIITGKEFAQVLRERLFEPLGMVDTAHVLRAGQVPRLVALYRGEDDTQPEKPGLYRLDNVPWPDAHIVPVPRTSGVGGLVTSQADMLSLVRHLGAGQLLRPDTAREMTRDQLPADRCVQFFGSGPYPSLGFGLGGAITRAASALQPATPAGEMQWGGLAGTHWSVSPASGVSIVLMAQRYMGFWNPYWFAYKQKVYEALGKAGQAL